MPDIKISTIIFSVTPNLWNNIAESLQSNEIEYEVIVVGPNTGEVPPKFRHIQTNVKPVQCYEINLRNASGELVMWTGDYATYSSQALDNAYSFWKAFNNEKLVIAFKTIKDGIDRTEMNRFFHGDIKYPRMAPFGLMSRRMLSMLGGYDKRFICGRAENDMIMRVAEAGGIVHVCPDAAVFVHNEETQNSSYIAKSSYDYDRNVLVDDWVI